MYTEADIRLHLDAVGFVPFVGKTSEEDFVRRARPRVKRAQLKAQAELERRRRQYDRLGYERQIMRAPRLDGPSIEQIIAAVALVFKIPRTDILTPSRKRQFSVARHVIAWELRQRKNFSVVKIGQILDRDHTTITHSVQYMHRNGHELRKQLEAVARLLEQGVDDAAHHPRASGTDALIHQCACQ